MGHDIYIYLKIIVLKGQIEQPKKTCERFEMLNLA